MVGVIKTKYRNCMLYVGTKFCRKVLQIRRTEKLRCPDNRIYMNISFNDLVV